MGDLIEKTKKQLNEYYQSLNKKQKIKIALGSFFLVTSIALTIFFITKPEYVPLYSGLSLEEAGTISSKLNEMSIPWKDENNGTTILVPKDYVNKARMNLAIEGIPQKGYTWDDAFNSNSFTITSEERRMRYLRALMNSLARTIEEINGVNNARVHLTVPDDSTYILDNNNNSKASVFLSLSPGVKLTAEQVNGIVMLVANSVEGLNPENVSVHDDSGSVLNNSSKNDSNYAITNQIDLQLQIQNRLEQSIKKLLSRIYGSENIDVMVNVELDFNREVTNIKEFTSPIEGETTGLIRSIAELKEQVINGVGGGPPGTDSNTEEITEYLENDSNSSKYDKLNKSVNYELNEIRRNIVKAPGQVKNITIAVIINTKSLVDGELTEEHKRELTNLVSAAAGLETKVVEVMAKEFNGQSSNQLVSISSEDNSKINVSLPTIGISAIALLLIIGAMVFVYRIRRRKIEMEQLMQPDNHMEEPIQEIDMDSNNKSSYKYQIEKFVDKKPEAVAQLLKTWLNED